MMKVCVLLALTFVAGVAAQDGAASNEAAPEPYSYAYQTDSHAASEQRDQQGRVTGFYTLTDADGRERRVEYVADEAGFRAKVATNEVGTKSESPADVEVVAAEPTPAQYAAYTTYQASAPAAAPAPQVQYVRQQAAVQAAPAVQTSYARVQQQSAYNVGYAQPAYGSYGYYGYNTPAYGYVSGAAAPAGQYYSYRSSAVPATTGYTASYAPAGYGYVSSTAAPAGYGYVSSNAAPAGQYYSYRSSVAAPATGSVGYAYRSSSVPVSAYSSYSTVPVATASATRSASQGSSNYLVLQKREAANEEKKAASS